MYRILVNTIVLFRLINSQLYDPSAYTLDTNLLINPTFSNPTLAVGVDEWFFSTNSVPGWIFTPNGQIVNIPLKCSMHSLGCTNNFTQAIDTATTGIFPIVSQDVTVVSTSEYLLTIGWMAPRTNPIGKSFQIKVDGVFLDNVICSTNTYNNQLNQYLVNLTAGTRQVSVQGSGVYLDGQGIYIAGVYLQQLIANPSTPTQSTSQNSETSLKVFNQLMLNDVLVELNNVPASRIFFYTITNFMITFDRLQLYYYHRHNLTNSSEALLSNLNTLALDKGSLPQSLLQGCNASVCNSINGLYEDLKGSFDQKKNYTDPFFLEKSPDGLGFFANNLDFFFYELPASLLICLLLSLLFRALFNYRISKYIRKYSFNGIFLFIIYEGNIEQFAFYFFTECRNLFSFNFKHKIANVVMIYFFFVVIVFSVGGLVWFMVNLKRLTKYFLEDSKEVNLNAVMIETLERSIYPLIFGAVHALMIDDLLAQSIVLFSIELSYFAVKVWVLKSTIPLYKFKVGMLLCTSLLRLFFIVTFYVYEQQGHPSIINLVHYDMVWLYLICWAVEFFHDFLVVIGDFTQAIKGQACVKKRKPLQKPAKSTLKNTTEAKEANEKKNSKGKKEEKLSKEKKRQISQKNTKSKQKSKEKSREKSKTKKQKSPYKKDEQKDGSSKMKKEVQKSPEKSVEPVRGTSNTRPSALKRSERKVKTVKPTQSHLQVVMAFRVQDADGNRMTQDMVILRDPRKHRNL